MDEQAKSKPDRRQGGDQESGEDGLVFEAPLFRVRRGLKTAFTQAEARPAPKAPRGESAARMLALGYRIRMAVESGEVDDFAGVARRMGVTRAWVSNLVDLTFVPRGQQEQILGLQTDGVQI